jgi:hypothetical protein
VSQFTDRWNDKGRTFDPAKTGGMRLTGPPRHDATDRVVTPAALFGVLETRAHSIVVPGGRCLDHMLRFRSLLFRRGIWGLCFTSRYPRAIDSPPGTTAGKPTTGFHGKGDIYMDSAGTLFVCVAFGNPGTWPAIHRAAQPKLRPAITTGLSR